MSRSHTNNINGYIIAHGESMIDFISFITNCVFAYLFSYHFSLQVVYGYYQPTTSPNNFIYSLLFTIIL